jgi:FKBP-type peptidyl-prolyl cis-trans isomerase
MNSKALLIGLAAVALAACGYPAPSAATGSVSAVSTTTPTPTGHVDNFNESSGKTPVKFPDGLQIIDLKIGAGETVKRGATVQAQYTGWLADGTAFDSSWSRGTPLCVILDAKAQGSGNCTSVIAGWTEGIPGMKVGGRRKLIIPASLGYGSTGASPVIPPNATLTFTIQVVAIAAEPTPTPSSSPSASPSSGATGTPSPTP